MFGWMVLKRKAIISQSGMYLIDVYLLKVLVMSISLGKLEDSHPVAPNHTNL